MKIHPFEVVLFFVLIFIMIFSFSFNSLILEYLIMFTGSKTIADALTVAITASLLGVLLTQSYRFVKHVFDVTEKSRQDHINTISSDLSQIKADVSEVSSCVNNLKNDVNDLRNNQTVLNAIVTTVQTDLNNVSGSVSHLVECSNEEKKRKQNFDLAWAEIKSDFSHLEDVTTHDYKMFIPTVIYFGDILKDTVRDYTIEVCESDLEVTNPEMFVEDLKDLFSKYESDYYVLIHNKLPEQFLTMFTDKITIHKKLYFGRLYKILSGKLNGRKSAVTHASHDFLRDLWVDLYAVWTEYMQKINKEPSMVAIMKSGLKGPSEYNFKEQSISL